MDKRLITQRQKIIAALQDAGFEGMTNVELSKISLRYGGHIGTLSKQGYKIQKVNLDGGLFRYFLVTKPSQEKLFKSANEETFEAMAKKHNEEVADDLKKYLDESHFHIVRKGGWYQKEYFGGLDNAQ
jgi:hypothetical protein